MWINGPWALWGKLLYLDDIRWLHVDSLALINVREATVENNHCTGLGVYFSLNSLYDAVKNRTIERIYKDSWVSFVMVEE